MKNRLITLLSLSLFFLLFGCSNKENSLNKKLNEVSNNLNKDVPIQFDDHTLFIGSEVDADNTFKYLYQIINIDDIEAMMDEVEAQTKANIKDAFELNPDLKIFTVNNVSVDYVYQDSLGQVIRTIHITPEDYK